MCVKLLVVGRHPVALFLCVSMQCTRHGLSKSQTHVLWRVLWAGGVRSLLAAGIVQVAIVQRWFVLFAVANDSLHETGASTACLSPGGAQKQAVQPHFLGYSMCCTHNQLQVAVHTELQSTVQP